MRERVQHKKEDVQQFAAGALANLQLYRRKEEALEGAGAPKSSMSRKVAKILRRKGGGAARGSSHPG